jgi:serine/threonine protein kinase
MTPEQWQRVRPILESALELDPASRASYLDGACADSILRGEVESLIASHEQAGTDVLTPGHPLSVDFDQETRFRLPPGKRIGAYEILEEIAVGGMGAVYRAVRADGQYDQQVALKIVRSELGAEFTATRFKNERQILASLNHPNIAKILDGGTTAEDVPYFVMELVEGQRLDEYCDAQELATTQRLNLFLHVCSAVQYAHQRLIIHRDIKPGNILVTAEGVPKLLDFGIAKILDSNETANQPAQTISLVRLLTPEYASPEQVKGEPITTASDVYSLGVVLYELLTGRTPYNVPTHTPHEVSRAICEAEPEKPSTAVRRALSSGQEHELVSPAAPARSEVRESSLEKLSKRLRGDLDNIVLMALRKEPQRRYASVEQFAQDIRRHLEHLPVIARQVTFGYRASKFITRHKAGVAAAVLVTVVLLISLGVTLRQARVAQRRFNDARQLANSLIFEVHDSIQDLPGSTPVRKLIVDRALHYLDSLSQESRGDLSLQRELAAAYERVGMVQGHYLQNNLGDTHGGLISYQKALKIRQQIAAQSRDSSDGLSLARAYRLVSNQQWALGDHAGALRNITEAVATAEALNNAHPKDLKILSELGSTYEIAAQIQSRRYAGGPVDDASSRENYRKAAAIDESMLAIDPEDLKTLNGYAIDLSHLGDSFKGADRNVALGYYEKELEIEKKLHQRSTDIRYARGVAVAYGDIALLYDQMGDHSRALENNARDLAIYEELIRVDPQNTLLQQGLAIAYANTANQIGWTGGTAQSLDYMDKSLKIMRGVVVSAPENQQQRGYLAAIYEARGTNLMRLHRPESALKEFDEARAIHESFHKADPSETGASLDAASCRKKMGEAAAAAGNVKLAAEYFLQAASSVEPMLAAQEVDPDALYVAADSYSGLGDLQLRQGRQSGHDPAKQKESWTQARSWYLKSLNAWDRIEHPRHAAPDDFDVGDPAKVAKSLQLCDAKLSGSN